MCFKYCKPTAIPFELWSFTTVPFRSKPTDLFRRHTYFSPFCVLSFGSDSPQNGEHIVKPHQESKGTVIDGKESLDLLGK